MPPFYDIYGFSKNRTAAFIEEFISKFTDRNSIESWPECEIHIYPNEDYGIKEKFISVNSLTEVISFGIKNPQLGFSFYLGKSKTHRDIKDIILKFTFDGYVIVGLSIEANLANGQDNKTNANKLKETLLQNPQIIDALTGIEEGPVDDFEEFMEVKKRYTTPK